MKQHTNSLMIFCIVIIITSLLCISCKYIDDSFLPKKGVATSTIKNSDYLSQSKDESLENMDSLTGIFDENGNIISIENDSISLSNEDKFKNNNINATNNSTNPASVVSKNNLPEKGNVLFKTNATSQKTKSANINISVTSNKNLSEATKTETAKKIKSNTGRIPTMTHNSKETDAERDYRLQKSNHAIPDL